MRRRHILHTLAGTYGGLAGCIPSPYSQRERETSGCTYRNPVYEEFVFPDPSLLHASDGTYFACATYNRWGDDTDRPLVPIIRSPDLVNWTFVGEAFRERPNWKRGGVWAPDICRLEGQYLIYYSLAFWDDPNPGIGVAVSQSPTGPFEDRGELLRSKEIGVPNSIDPFFVVHGGTPYLFWGSHRGIFGIRLAVNGLSVAGEPFKIAGNDVEAATLLKHDGHYFLFVSTGSCCKGAESTYRVLVGRAEKFAGPYVDRTGNTLAAGNGVTVVRGGERFVGPGHTDVVRDDAGSDWLVYHAYERANPWVGETPRRVLLVSPLIWRDGWPMVSGRTPAVTGPCPETTT